ncbi:MAG: ABC transporter permease subunit [Anaerolineae bacterium]|nr:ABC transporter permease subunit [Anaerolineae bacterium]
MYGTVFLETLRQARNQVLYWSLGMGLLGVVMGSLVPLFNSQQLVELMESLPPFILAMAGIDEEMRILSTTEGVLAVGFFTRYSLIFAAYPIIMGMRVTMNEEDDGIMDVLLSLPVHRWQIIVERFLAYVLTMFVIIAAVYLGLILGTALAQVSLDLGRIAEALLASIPLFAVLLAFTMFVGTLLRNRRYALGAAAAFAVYSYMMSTVAQMIENNNIAQVVGSISVYHYFDVNSIVTQGVSWSNIGLLGALALILLGASLWFFQRRDVGL